MEHSQNRSEKFERLRRQAERLLGRQSEIENDASTDMLELIHELRIHQAELEIQNEELQRAQHEICELQQEYENLYEFAPCGYLTLDSQGLITHINLTGVRLLNADRKHVLRAGFSQFIDSGWSEAFYSARARSSATGQKQSIELPIKRNNEPPPWVRMDIEADRDEADAVTQWRVVLFDISEKKKAVQALAESENRFRMLLNTLHEGIWQIDAHGYTSYVNPQMARMLGYSVDEMEGKQLFDFMDERAKERCMRNLERRQQGISEQHEFEFQKKDGDPLYALLESVSLMDADGVYTGALAGVMDITRRKRAETALQDALAAKEILLREIHHRVNNNMQVIVALLRMHSRRIDDARLTAIFNDCRDRVEAMALIHGALYQSEDLAHVDFNAYCQKLCRNLGKAYNVGAKGITVTVGQSNVVMNMDEGVAVGMIITELISNAFKHAFPQDQTGNVAVCIDHLENETIQLVVADTGKGVPPDFDIHKTSSLGLRLVVATAERELGGDIQVENDGGARFIIRFKCEKV